MFGMWEDVNVAIKDIFDTLAQRINSEFRRDIKIAYSKGIFKLIRKDT